MKKIFKWVAVILVAVVGLNFLMEFIFDIDISKYTRIRVIASMLRVYDDTNLKDEQNIVKFRHFLSIQKDNDIVPESIISGNDMSQFMVDFEGRKVYEIKVVKVVDW